jgi:cation:H+ antiporter
MLSDTRFRPLRHPGTADFDQDLGVDLLTAFLFLVGFVLLILGAETLVRGGSRLAVEVGISPFVVGLTVVAYGTSAPELAVTVQSVYAEPPQPDLAVGNVVGSNIANILLVLGSAAACAPLIVSPNSIRVGTPLMIGVSLLMLLLSLDGAVSRLDGLLLFGGSIAYTLITVVGSHQHQRRLQAELDIPPPVSSGTGRVLRVLSDLGLVGLGLAFLTLGSRWLVQGAVAAATFFGVSELVIGLTIVAVGTSLPEVATSIVAACRGERDMAVGNVIGSNVFNVLMVLGACALFGPGEVTVSDQAFRFDMPVMIITAIACFPVFYCGWKITRWEGGVFLLYYAAYLIYLCLSATGHAALGPFRDAMLRWVVPLTGVMFLVYWYQSWMRKRKNPT